MRVLVIEDDQRVLSALSAVLRQHGVEVVGAADRRTALEAFSSEHPDLVLLDLGLPDGDGFEVCSRMRRMSDLPIIVVTARSDLQSRVHGLDLGADDYLVKPYDARELVARINAVTRRSKHALETGNGSVQTQPAVDVGQLHIDLAARRVNVRGCDVTLTRKEFDVLSVLATSLGAAVRRERLLSEVWNTSWNGAGRTLEVHIASLRSKLGAPELIETVRGVGYRLGTG